MDKLDLNLQLLKPTLYTTPQVAFTTLPQHEYQQTCPNCGTTMWLMPVGYQQACYLCPSCCYEEEYA